MIIERSRRGFHGPEGLSSPPARPNRLVVAALVAATGLALAGEAAGASLSTRLSQALASSGVSWSRMGAVVTKVSTGRLVYGRNGRQALRPASNEKLLVSVAALDELGPGSRIPTLVLGLGIRNGSIWRGSLFLKGFGDPTLSPADLRGLAWKVRRSGITRVTGAVLGDETFFDKRRTAPGWKPSFYKLECPPLSALVVDRAKVGRRTATYPALAAARDFKRALREAGVTIPGRARVGVAPTDAPTLARSLSPGLAYVVRGMNRKSDNFVAEMLLKRLGALEGAGGTTTAGAAIVRRELRRRGVPLGGIRIADGSGLSLRDRVTPRALAKLIRSAWRDTRIRQAFFVSLPRAGLEGTLEDRMESPPARGLVRAKTGTTDNASALSGFVGTTYVFSVLMNGSPVPWTSARRGQDRFAQILAGRVA